VKEKISIIIPVYNSAAYLPECIKSVTGQTYKNLEIILVDDGSTDNSGKLCDMYAETDKRIKVIHKENGGVSEARNTGIKAATAGYIGFVDSDDYIEEDMYEILYGILYSYDADIVECRFYKVIDGRKDIENTTGTIEQFDTASALESLISSRKLKVNVYNKIYKRKLLDNIEFPVNKINEDAAWTYKILARAEKLVHCDAVKYYQVIRRQSITQSEDYREKTDRFNAEIERLDFIHNNFNNLFNLAQKKMFSFILRKLNKFETNKDLDKNKEYSNKIKKYISDNFNSLCSNPLIGKEKIFIKLFKFSPGMSLKVLNFNNIFREIAKKLLKNNSWVLIKFKKIKTTISYNKTFLKKINEIRRKNKSIAYLLLLPKHGNIGDQAIAIAENKFINDNLKNFGLIEVLKNDTINSLKVIKKNIKSPDIIFLSGGGNIGDYYLKHEKFRRKIIEYFPENKIISFPQTIYFSDSGNGSMEFEKSKKIYNHHKNFTIAARETFSFNIMKNAFSKNKIILAPDMVLYLNQQDKKIKKQKVFVCLRNDSESIVDYKKRIELLVKLKERYKNQLFIGDTVLNHKITLKDREVKFDELLESFKQARIVITDRLHGMLFSAITGTPCIALQNYNHKIISSYEWLKDRDYMKLVEKFDTNEILDLCDVLYGYKTEKIAVPDLKDKFSELIPEMKIL